MTSPEFAGDFYEAWLRCKLITQGAITCPDAEVNLAATLVSKMLNREQELLKRNSFIAGMLQNNTNFHFHCHFCTVNVMAMTIRLL